MGHLAAKGRVGYDAAHPADGPKGEGRLEGRYRQQVAYWLYACCIMVLAMVVIGGVTRLTGSGLSIVNWEPVRRWLPPTSTAEWQAMFDLYRTSPEYLKVHATTMDLAGFQGIFWLEYIHRLVGRIAGMVFLFPFLFFLLTRRLPGTLAPRLMGIFLLGGAQGLLGWYMVKSGLVNDPSVSPYRLTAHLMLAFLIHVALFWTALSLHLGVTTVPPATTRGMRRAAWALTGLIALTVASGGFVAGLKAGHAFNTFPLMDGHWIPPEYGQLEPFWHNFFENIATVQWDHRLLAVVTLCSVLLFRVAALRHILPARTRNGLNFLVGVAMLQVGLGIATLLLEVPLFLAAGHQGNALILLTAALFVTHQLHHPAPMRNPI
ncbi:MAG: COX15/CtaA family protein [Magnetococcales bacterium]|nr:COX15/CtaA family protein [Magnetococcales bacterium]MBF0322726.1 COX15/CtaA family protein [Magnetococcales bacterium]